MAVQKNFVIQNGLEVNTSLIYANKDSNKVGIATTNPQYTLHVNGGIGVTNLSVSGISTVDDIKIDGRVTAGSSLGVAGQYLVSTGDGISWSSVPTVRTTDLQTAGVGATTFNTTYSVGLLDVYVNGVKLSADEYTANNGATVTLDDACFGGETVEFISYSPFGIGVGGTSIQGITILEEGSPVGSALQVTSINFVGAAVTATGSGVGVTVYVNDSVNPNYWVSTAAGIHTLSNVGVGTTNPRFALEVGAVGASGTTLYVNGDARITGILTVGSSSITLNGATNTINVGSGVTINGAAGTISATSFVGDGSGLVNVVGSGSGIVVLDDGSTVGTAGTINFGTNLSVSAISSGVVTVTASGGTSTQWVSTAAGIHTLSSVGIGTTNPTTALTVNGVIQTGVGSNFTFVSSAGFSGDGPEGRYLQLAYQTNPNYILNNVGIGTTNATSRLTVKGNTSLETLNVSGVSTLGTSNISGDLTFTGNNDIYLKDGGVINFGDGNDLQIFHNGSVSVIRDGGTGGLLIDSDNEVKIAKNGTGNDNLAVFTPDGSVELYYDNSKKFETLGAGVTVTGTTFTNDLSVSGIATFAGSNVKINSGNSLDFGTGAGDLHIYRQSGGSNDSIIKYDGAYNFKVLSDITTLASSAGSVTWGVFGNNGVELYYGNSKKFATLGAGVTVTGTTFTNQLSVSGVSTFNTVAISSATSLHTGTNNRLIFGNDLEILSSSGTNYVSTNENPLYLGVRVQDGGPVIEATIGLVNIFPANDVYYGNNSYVTLGFGTDGARLQTLGAGVTVTGTTFTNQLSVSGVSTFSGNVRVGVDTSSGVILTSPNGTQYRLIVDNSGTLSTVAV